MRIAGYIEHPTYKITIFQMENRFVLKFETPLFEHSYKLSFESGIRNISDIEQMVDTNFLWHVDTIFLDMSKNMIKAKSAHFPIKEDEFEEII